MDAVFYFSFYNDDCDEGECTARHVGFCVSNIGVAWSELEDNLADVASELELEYGVHDWSTTPSGVNAIGYHSSEVEPERRDELMEVWRQAFEEHAPHCVVSEVFDVPNMEDMNDAEILHYLQSQHTRVSLNTQISGGSPASPKKM